MGWTECHATHYKNGRVDVKTECESLINDDIDEVLKTRVVGSTVYMAVRRKRTGEVWAAVFLTSVNNRGYFNFGYNAMDETEGPCECRCPDSILDMLTPTECISAKEWRERCREHNRKKKALAGLPIGSAIRFGTGERERTLVKCAPAYQFKRPFWMVDGTMNYFPHTRIPEDYEVLERGEAAS